MGAYAFYGCSSLAYNEYNDGLYIGNDTNPYLCFVKMKDNKKTSLTMNDDTEIVADKAFSYSFSLKQVKLSNKLKTIPHGAFGMCTALEEVEIPHGIISIKDKAFDGCKKIKSVTIPDTVVEIGRTAFSGCKYVKFEIRPGCFADEFAQNSNIEITYLQV